MTDGRTWLVQPTWYRYTAALRSTVMALIVIVYVVYTWRGHGPETELTYPQALYVVVGSAMAGAYLAMAPASVGEVRTLSSVVAGASFGLYGIYITLGGLFHLSNRLLSRNPSTSS